MIRAIRKSNSTKMKAHRVIILTVLLLCLSNVYGFSQSQIGEGNLLLGVQSLVSKWLLVDNEKPVITIAGSISEIRYNDNGHWYDDLDWCIFLNPDTVFDWCKYNSLQQKNADNRIEMEVKSKKTNIQQFFSPGDFVIAKGKWVEDTGHGASNFDKPARYTTDGFSIIEIRGKTELHPLTFLRTGSTISAPNTIGTFSSVPTKIFMAQDASGRFYAAGDTPVEETFSFSANDNTRPFFIMNLLDDQSGSYNVKVYRESADIKGNAVATLDHINEALVYNVSIPPYSSGEGGAFMGVFSAETKALLKCSTQATLITGTQPGTDALKFQVELELLDPDGANFEKRWWTWEEDFLDGTRAWLTTEDYRKISYELIYSPSTGHKNSNWSLYVLGNSKPWGWYPTSTTSASDRVTGISRGSFGLLPSLASLTTEQLGKDCCVVKSNLNLIKHAYVINSNWFIKVLKDGDGNRISNPGETILTPGQHEIQGLTVITGVGQVKVIFKHHSGPTTVGPNGMPCNPYGYNGRCQIIYRGKTNLGETFECVTEEFGGLGGLHCPDTDIFDPRELMRILIGLKLKQGLGFPDPTAPEEWPHEVIKEMENTQYVSLGELYKLSDMFKGENKKAVEALLGYIRDGKVKDEDWELLAKFHKLAAKLPDLKVFKSETKRMESKFDAYSVPVLRKPHDAMGISKMGLKRTRDFWIELAKHRIPRF